jgi:threonyl-tRNA synthetase
MEQELLKKRHSLAHVLAAAVLRIWPKAKLAIGPAIDKGFYYDIDFGQEKISEADLKTIEKEMVKILKQNLDFKPTKKSIKEALKEAKEENNQYKQELIEDLIKSGHNELSYYEIDTFKDLCSGPHIKNTKEILPASFKLHKIAGAYWRGDENKAMLTRIYGLAFNTKDELKKYLNKLQEAVKRDHRKLAKELDLYHIDDMVGLGLPLWHPKGAKLYKIIEDFWHFAHEEAGYQLVKTPHIGNQKLWQKSGHWGFYNDSMYAPFEAGQSLMASENKEAIKESEKYLLKPMNCPFHIQIYNHNLHSYRELPIKWAESGTVYRFEKKGELSGLTRVRGFTQDDAHIICTKDQVEKELENVVDFILYIYKSFGFNLESIKVYLSVRDPENQKYAGSEEGWTLTENILEKVAQKKKLNYEKDIGGAVFYGPKLDFKIKDVLDRQWQCSTLQFDFNLPERFDMTFTNQEGKKDRPYMLHRALFGSYERFIGLLIEHYGGAFPLWLSPNQLKIIPVNLSHLDYCEKLKEDFKSHNIRVEVDKAEETVGNKIRKAVKEKPPYILVIGDKELNSDTLNIRDRGKIETREIKKNDFIQEILDNIKNKK